MTVWSPSEHVARRHAKERSLSSGDEWVVMQRYDVYAALPVSVAGSPHVMHGVERARYRMGYLLEPSHADK